MREDDIKNAIINLVYRYSDWTIGITDNPSRRKSEHRNPKDWYRWRANTENVARRIERYFLGKGMSGDTGGGINPNYVYIFKHY